MQILHTVQLIVRTQHTVQLIVRTQHTVQLIVRIQPTVQLIVKIQPTVQLNKIFGDSPLLVTIHLKQKVSVTRCRKRKSNEQDCTAFL
jgi:hypothetical protein